MTDNQDNKPINLIAVPNFSTHFDKYISQELREIEDERKHALKLFKICLIALIILIFTVRYSVRFAMYLYDMEICPQLMWVPPVINLSAIMLLIYMIPNTPKTFKERSKVKLLNKLFAYLGDFRYQSKCQHSFFYYNNIQCLKPFIKNSYIDDCITGKYKDIPVEIKEFQLYLKFTSLENSNSIILLSLPQIKKVNTNLNIRNKKFFSAHNVGEDVILEDLEFNKIYQTSTGNYNPMYDRQIESRYILTPTFIEYLKDLDANGITITCCFQDEQVHIAIPAHKNMFEPTFFKSALKAQPYREIIEQLERVLKIIDILKLDNDIGL